MVEAHGNFQACGHAVAIPGACGMKGILEDCGHVGGADNAVATPRAYMKVGDDGGSSFHDGARGNNQAAAAAAPCAYMKVHDCGGSSHPWYRLRNSTCKSW